MGSSRRRHQELAALDTEVRCWSLYVEEGLTTRAIAARLGITFSAVAKALRRAQKRARARLTQEIGLHKTLALERLDRLYFKAVDDYEKSAIERQRRRTKRRSGGAAGEVTETEIVSEGRVGNPAYLGKALEAVREIKKLLGLDAPTRIQSVDPDRPDRELSDQQLHEELAAMLRVVGVDAPTLVPGPKKVQ